MAKLVGLFTIANEPQLRFTPQGKAVINLSLPDNYGQKDGQGNQPTQWYDVALWGKRAEALAPYLVKGKQAFFVVKDIHIETYQGKNGETSKLVGFVEDVQLARSGEQQAPQQSQQPAQAAPQAQQAQNFDDFDDQIPF